MACLVVLPLAAAMHGIDCFRPSKGSHVVRTVCLVTAMSLYFLAIARIPLATAVSAYFVGPIVAALLSVAVLRSA